VTYKSTLRKKLETMVHPDVDGYTKTPIQRKILRKTKKGDNLLKTKRILKPKYKLNGDLGFTFS